MRLPLNKVGSLNKINKAFSELEQTFEREPSPEELAELLEITTDEVETTLGVAARHVSMDAPFVEGEDNSLLDVLENNSMPGTDTHLEYADSLRREIERSLGTLTDRQCDVIKLYFGIGVEHPMSLEDIGDKFGLTRERVRQIKDKAINKLRATSRSKLLKTYLGRNSCGMKFRNPAGKGAPFTCRVSEFHATTKRVRTASAPAPHPAQYRPPSPVPPKYAPDPA